MKKITTKVVKGGGMASKLGFPTVNFVNESEIDPGIYLVNEEKYGSGVAFISRNLGEMHFFKEIFCDKDTITYSLKEKIVYTEDRMGSSIGHIYYLGLKKYEELWKN